MTSATPYWEAKEEDREAEQEHQRAEQGSRAAKGEHEGRHISTRPATDQPQRFAYQGEEHARERTSHERSLPRPTWGRRRPVRSLPRPTGEGGRPRTVSSETYVGRKRKEENKIYFIYIYILYII